jgi:hypothetical protein
MSVRVGIKLSNDWYRTIHIAYLHCDFQLFPAFRIDLKRESGYIEAGIFEIATYVPFSNSQKNCPR